jgi:hypothetical protein
MFHSDFVMGYLERQWAEEVGFEPTARTSSSIAVRERPPRAQKAHRGSTDIRSYTLSSAGSAVNSAVKKYLLVRGYYFYDSPFQSVVCAFVVVHLQEYETTKQTAWH